MNLGEIPEYEVESACSENATSEIQDPAPNAHLRAPKRKRWKSTLSFQEEIVSFREQKPRMVD
jgi:hypothetical protein